MRGIFQDSIESMAFQTCHHNWSDKMYIFHPVTMQGPFLTVKTPLSTHSNVNTLNAPAQLGVKCFILCVSLDMWLNEYQITARHIHTHTHAAHMWDVISNELTPPNTPTNTHTLVGNKAPNVSLSTCNKDYLWYFPDSAHLPQLSPATTLWKPKFHTYVVLCYYFTHTECQITEFFHLMKRL